MNRTVAPLLLTLVALAAVAPLRGQGQPAAEAPQPPVTFRAEVNYVEVDARVFDAQGQFVAGLSEGDFEVLEDGKPQKVTVFSLVNIPVERAERPLFAAAPIEPDVQSNTRGYDGRVYLIVLDDLHTHPLRTVRVRQAAREFIERFVGANDVAAVVHTSGRGDAGQEFTSNPRLLLAAVDKFSGRKLRSATLERLDMEYMTRNQRQQGERVDDPASFERGHQARSALQTVKNLADFMAGVRGRRKAMVLFSEGIDYDITDPFTNQDATMIMDATRDVIAAATRANVAIYGVDARGLASAGDESITVGAFPDDRSLGIDSSSLQNEVRLGQDSLRVLSDETGGFAVVNQNDLRSAFRRLVDDNSSYYVLGYYPANDRRDGRFRRIDVRVARPGMTVRARRGYVAPRGRAPADTRMTLPGGAPSELRDAMSSPIPVSSLPVSVNAVAFKGPRPNAVIALSILLDGRDLALVEKNGVLVNDIDVVATAVNYQGKMFPGDRSTVNLQLKPDTAARVRAAGFRVLTQIALPPGRYQLRVAASEANGKRAGSVLYDLDVPDFDRERFSMSGLAITSISSSVAPSARQNYPLNDLLPGPLSTLREFPVGDELAIFTEVYDNTAATPHKVDISAVLKADAGPTVFQTSEERDSSELQGRAGGYGFAARIPLGDVAPGLYLLRVEAASRVGNQPPVAREVLFRVVPRPAP
ncbi:MAG: VWA domain-containing protein [Vicinamibacterales bacterium]|nr:VWA domain-containing protein [Vicinamibacterales bacterium]